MSAVGWPSQQLRTHPAPCGTGKAKEEQKWENPQVKMKDEDSLRREGKRKTQVMQKQSLIIPLEQNNAQPDSELLWKTNHPFSLCPKLSMILWDIPGQLGTAFLAGSLPSFFLLQPACWGQWGGGAGDTQRIGDSPDAVQDWSSAQATAVLPTLFSHKLNTAPQRLLWKTLNPSQNKHSVTSNRPHFDIAPGLLLLSVIPCFYYLSWIKDLEVKQPPWNIQRLVHI